MFLQSLLLAALPLVQDPIPTVRIGVVVDGPWQRYSEDLALYRDELLALTRGEIDVQFPSAAWREADWTAEGVRAALDASLADPDVDMVITLGVVGSDIACHMTDLPKPVVAPIVIDPELQGIGGSELGSGVPNLSYLMVSPGLPAGVEALASLAEFKRIAFIFQSDTYEALRPFVDDLLARMGSIGIEATVALTDGTAESALADLSQDIDAVFVSPLFSITEFEFDEFVQGLIDRRLPSFAIAGARDVHLGLLASAGPELSSQRHARHVALHVQRILLGEEPSEIFTPPVPHQITVNMRTAREIGVWPSFAVLTEAILINADDEDVERELTLGRVFSEVYSQNIDTQAARSFVRTGRQSVREARSVLRPQLDLASEYTALDPDRAGLLNSERSWTGSIGLSQILYSESANAGLDIEKNLQDSREAQERTIRLDVALQAGTAYLSLLRAKSLEEIQRKNLALTRSNYDLAVLRQRIGVADMSEVYRWESQIAQDRQAVITQEALRMQAKIAVNRVLHRPLEEPFNTFETGIEDPALMDVRRVESLISNEWDARIFRDFMVDEGLASSPELAALDAGVAAQERTVLATRRAFTRPDVALFASVDDVFHRSGEGDDLFDDAAWTAGVSLSFPLYQGGGRTARYQGARIALQQLKWEREARRERLEAQIRSQIHATGATFTNIELSREGAIAASKNLDLIEDAYKRGAVPIITLLDAQNAAIIADQRAANAVFDFLIDLIETERSTGRFAFFESVESREDWFARLESYFALARARR